jgi:hypothetical protein
MLRQWGRPTASAGPEELEAGALVDGVVPSLPRSRLPPAPGVERRGGGSRRMDTLTLARGGRSGSRRPSRVPGALAWKGWAFAG